MTTTDEFLSQRMEALATQRGLAVWRAASDVIEVSVDGQRLYFRGAIGPGNSQASARICERPFALRRVLQQAGVATVPTTELPARATSTARHFVRRLGTDARLRLVDHPSVEKVVAGEEFDRKWGAFVDAAPQQQPLIRLEPADLGRQCCHTVAFGQVIGSGPDLARAAVAALPGIEVADVLLGHGAHEDPWVIGVDPGLRRLADSATPAPHRDHVLNSILAGEIARLSRPEVSR
ncbi:hypothetical protein [Natronoglycomyces albus]|uniref:Uncharacterized protein n=1 Tax=Natronoglycomyces albus TaxID=2811108 RepID=A0A895XIN1_9ACTN|nr:hypothetical protein [Natronoglycomyces albus]QSB04817.1 hypothetical protein JQS30_13745 [Natronoglycomyces albus]